MKIVLALVLSCFLVPLSRAEEKLPPIKIKQAENHLDVTVGDQPFTTYWFGQREDRIYVRPFFYPVLAEGGVEVTSDQYAIAQKNPKTDHPHHQSLWVSHSEVNGVDHWSLGKDNKGTHSAKQRHVKFDSIGNDNFVEELIWDDNDGKPMLNEKRTVKFIVYGDGCRAIDITSAFTPAAGKVVFGDAKDAGFMAVRMATQISKDPTLTESTGISGEGLAGEKLTWGKRADWCDESGKIDGKPLGIAIFDSPNNPNHPTHWHVRAYGLMSANIFGLSDFENAPKHTGDYTLEPGKTLTFEHRAVIHPGMAGDAKLAEKYQEFAKAVAGRAKK